MRLIPVGDGFEVSDGSEVVMRLPYRSYGALYQAELVGRLLELVKAGDVHAAWRIVDEALALADSLECPWCDQLGLHQDCWTPGTADKM